jgi:hypothetical protein
MRLFLCQQLQFTGIFFYKILGEKSAKYGMARHGFLKFKPYTAFYRSA